MRDAISAQYANWCVLTGRKFSLAPFFLKAGRRLKIFLISQGPGKDGYWGGYRMRNQGSFLRAPEPPN